MADTMVLDMENAGRETVLDENRLDDSGLPVSSDKPQEIDAALDPMRVNAITKAAMSDEPEDFKIEGPPDGSCTLIAGYVTPDGSRYTSAEVRELRGRDEESLARAFATGDMTRYIDAILKAGVVSVGPVTGDKELAVALDSLLLGDRDMLVLQIRRNGYGDLMRLDVKCPWCTAEFQVDYSFSTDVPLHPFEVEGLTDLSVRTFAVDCPSGAVVELRLVDGKAQKLVYSADNLKKTDAELNTLLLREVISNIDGVVVKGFGPVLDMASRDRMHLLKWLAAGQPGPHYDEVKQDCAECAREFPLVVSLRDMFRGD